MSYDVPKSADEVEPEFGGSTQGWPLWEVFVRAKVVSDAPHPNPQHPGEVERAWTQPVRRPAAPDEE